MPANDQMNWQPISQMPLIASMIDTALDDTREHLATLTKARAKPHVLDDATVDRVEKVHAEQMEFVAIYAQQIDRWRNEKPSASQTRTLIGWPRRTSSCVMSPATSWPWRASFAKVPSSGSSG